jgi:hypothetical protein
MAAAHQALQHLLACGAPCRVMSRDPLMAQRPAPRPENTSKMIVRRCLRWLAAALFLHSLLFSFAEAHDAQRSELRLEIRQSEVMAQYLLDAADFKWIDFSGNEVVEQEEFDQAVPRLVETINSHVQLRSGTSEPSLAVTGYELRDGHYIRLDITYAFPSRLARLSMTSSLWRATAPGHQQFITAQMGGELQQAVLDVRHPSFEFSTRGSSRWRAALRFIAVGLEHIFTGYDHLAFLLLLAVAAANVRTLVLTATCFTVAHSLTLALAVLNIVAPPAKMVESAIALSIAYVALENMANWQFAPRYVAVFLFGLVHGIGFSGVLREMALPRTELLVSLLTFNVGIEIGQVVVVSVVYFALKRAPAGHRQRIAIALSGLVLLVAIYWLVQRAVL